MTLLERLALATGPSRELDAEIAQAIGYEHRSIGIAHPDNCRVWYDNLGAKLMAGLPHFTGSIDAAITLIPEGWKWMLFSDCDVHMESLTLTEFPTIAATAKTIPLALCSAAIQAILTERT